MGDLSCRAEPHRVVSDVLKRGAGSRWPGGLAIKAADTVFSHGRMELSSATVCIHGVPKGPDGCARCAAVIRASKPVRPRRKKLCYHGREQYYCLPCHGGGFCRHLIQRKTCLVCRGTEVCKHDKQRAYCAECGGRQVCRMCRARSSTSHPMCAACRRKAASEPAVS